MKSGQLYSVTVSKPTYLYFASSDDLYAINSDGNLEKVWKWLYVPQAGTVYLESEWDVSHLEIYTASVSVVQQGSPQTNFYTEFDELYDIEGYILSSYLFNVELDGGAGFTCEYDDDIPYCELYIDGKENESWENLLSEGNYHIKYQLASGTIIFEGDIVIKSVKEDVSFVIKEGGKLQIDPEATIYFELQIEEAGKYAFLSSTPGTFSIDMYNVEDNDRDYYINSNGDKDLGKGTYYIKVSNESNGTQELRMGKWLGINFNSKIDTIFCLNSFDVDWLTEKIDCRLECTIKTSVGNYNYMYNQIGLSYGEIEVLDSDGKPVYSDRVYAGNTYRFRKYFNDEVIYDQSFYLDNNVPLTEIVLDTTYKMTPSISSLLIYYTYTPKTNQMLEVGLKALPTGEFSTIDIYCYKYVNNVWQKVDYVDWVGHAGDIKEYYVLEAGVKYVFTAYDDMNFEEEEGDFEWYFCIDEDNLSSSGNKGDALNPNQPEGGSEVQSTLPKVGTQHTVSNSIYKVTKSSAAHKEVTFVKPKNSKKTSVTIPTTIKIDGQTYKVTEVASKAFKNNKKLKSATIGKNVKKIGQEAFSGCKKLKKITIKSTVLKSIGKNAIKGIDKKATIKCPKKQLSKYKKLFKSKTGYKKTMKIKK